MIDALKFVQGAVAKKDFAPELTHFSINEGVILGYNGTLSLSSPIDLDLNIYPKAIPFAKAINTCKDTVVMAVTPAGRLSVKSGKFKAFIECMDEYDFPHLKPAGEYVELSEGFIPALANVIEFIGQDASRPWAAGLLFKDKKVFATNNIVVAEQTLAFDFPFVVNIPSPAIKELLRIKQNPIGMQADKHSITFHFEGDRYLRSSLFDIEWPNVSRILDRESEQKPVPAGFFEALEDLRPFVEEDNRIYFIDGALTTNINENEGATVEVAGITAGACFQHKQLALLEKRITSIDFAMYPAPCIFAGDDFRGAITGMRV